MFVNDNKNKISLSDFGPKTKYGKSMRKYYLVYEMYSALAEIGTLTVDDMQHIQADPTIVSRLKADAEDRSSFMEDISSRINEGHLKIENIDLVVDDVLRYNLMLWFCKQFVHKLDNEEGFVSRDNMDFFENYLYDEEHKELYTYIVKLRTLGYDEFEEFYDILEDHNLLVDGYTSLIESNQLNLDDIKKYRDDLEKYNLMEMAYRESIIPLGYLTVDNLEDYRDELEKYNLMEMVNLTLRNPDIIQRHPDGTKM
ncbi:hypothetical protein CYMTET_41239 [Cymbomonas tetramitiformis]|uniref:Uncharacterized protein n=1 Tax=Cymbomonas tetramitiformis TaxID=36881 RepID=A0AAE0F2P3_9CHLO|nr:hypothetical protein CYMTET_41239 [Cymbomonas tetramitiformis]